MLTADTLVTTFMPSSLIVPDTKSVTVGIVSSNSNWYKLNVSFVMVSLCVSGSIPLVTNMRRCWLNRSPCVPAMKLIRG